MIYDVGQEYAHPIGQKKPNGFGLVDMHGNVYEWCGDWYEEAYYSKSPIVDPQGPNTGTYRVYRGGSWRWAILWKDFNRSSRRSSSYFSV